MQMFNLILKFGQLVLKVDDLMLKFRQLMATLCNSLLYHIKIIKSNHDNNLIET